MDDLCGISATPGRGNEESVETRFRGQCRSQSRNPYGPVLGYRSRLLGFHRSLGSAYLYYPCSVRHSNRLSLIASAVCRWRNFAVCGARKPTDTHHLGEPRSCGRRLRGRLLRESRYAIPCFTTDTACIARYRTANRTGANGWGVVTGHGRRCR